MKGISPIVAVVLLIAIAVIAAVGLYFWVGTLTSKQATPNTPTVIQAVKLGTLLVPGSTNVKTTALLIQNLYGSPITTACLPTTKGEMAGSNHVGVWCIFHNSTVPLIRTINQGEQKECELINLTYNSSVTNYAVYNGTWTGDIGVYFNKTSTAIVHLSNDKLANFQYTSGWDPCYTTYTE